MLTNSFPPLASTHQPRYCLPVTANSVNGFGDLSNLAHKRPITNSWRFFCARSSCLWRLCVGDLWVCRIPSFRFANLRTAATLNRLATIRGSFKLNLELYQ